MNKNPLTRAGYERLRAEFDDLQKVERPKVVKGVSDAAAEGDRSENAEYIYGKKRLREIDKRLQYLATLLKNVQIYDENALHGMQVCFASTVVVRDENGKVQHYTIVGDGEADFSGSTISHRSPLAKGLLGKHVGDVAEIERPKGRIELEVIGLLFGNRLIAGVHR